MIKMDLKGYFIFRGNIYDSSDIMQALLKNPRIRVSINKNEDLIIDGEIIRKINEPIENVISNLLCFKSLAYCCSLEKPCSNRDLALKLLSLDKRDYIELKEELDRKFIGRKSSENFQKDLMDTKLVYEENTSRIDSLDDTNITSFFESDSPFESEGKKLETDKREQLFDFFEKFGDDGNSRTIKSGICEKCGCKVGPYTRFCPNCGKSIK
jgi:hypothetical protein